MSVVEPGGSGDVPIIPDGLYTATITAVKDVTLDEPDRFGNQEKVELQVSFTADGEDFTLDPRVNRKWGEKATLFSIAQACGLDPDPYASFDTDDLNHCKVKILVETPEEGKWPRVKAWSRVRGSKASAPSQKPTEASETPALIQADGEVNWTLFWRTCRDNGVTREMFADELGDVNKLPTMDAADVIELYEILRGRLG